MRSTVFGKSRPRVRQTAGVPRRETAALLLQRVAARHAGLQLFRNLQRGDQCCRLRVGGERGQGMIDANACVGTHDVLLLTLDTLRYDVADACLRGPHTEPGGRAAAGRLGGAALARQLHLRRPPGVLRRLPADARTSRPAPAPVRRALPRQRDHRPREPASSTHRTSSAVWPGGATIPSASAASASSTAESAGPRAAGPVRREPLGPGARRDRPGVHGEPGGPGLRRLAEMPAERRVFLFLNVSADPPAELLLPAGRYDGLAGDVTPRPWPTSTPGCRRCSRRCGAARRCA